MQVKVKQLPGLLIFFNLLTFINGRNNSLDDFKCPKLCYCTDVLIDCSSQHISKFPIRLPENTEKLDVHSNSILELPEGGIQHLKRLRIMRLNENRISRIPDDFLSSSYSLLRIDLSHNRITEITRHVFKRTLLLRSIQLDNNQITCIHEHAFKELKELEILTLNNNNLTVLAGDVFKTLPKLKTLRLSDNPITCDCNLAWLSFLLQRTPRLSPHLKCYQPSNLRGISFADLKINDLKCSGHVSKKSNNCKERTTCSLLCKCGDGIVDCRKKSLTKLPVAFPEETFEIRFEQNYVSEIQSKVFTPYGLLKRIDLSNNNISEIAYDAFAGLKYLTSLVLYGNKIKSLPAEIFSGLTSLQLLLLNANEISCLKKDTFKDLNNLTLLSLYDNNIKTLSKGTFDSLTKIKTLHLAKNPFNCDCDIIWLTEYLENNPIETSGARCHTPKHLSKRRLETIGSEIQCTGKHSRTKNPCEEEAMCFSDCICMDRKVDCSYLNLTEIDSHDLPASTLELIAENNQMTDITDQEFLRYVPNLERLSLRGNKISYIVANVFNTSRELVSIDLSHNQLSEINHELFIGLYNLRNLDLSNNKLIRIGSHSFAGLDNLNTLILNFNAIRCIHKNAFFGLENLRMLALYGNNISTIAEGTFNDLKNMNQIVLGANPFYCDCNLRWLSKLFKESYIESGIARCSYPAHMENKLILSTPDRLFECGDVIDSAIMDKCSPCDENSCQNNADCKPDYTNDSYECVCPEGTYGKYCEKIFVDPCSSGPCENGGTCNMEAYNQFTCTCPDYATGEHCEIKLTDCTKDRCKNNATCSQFGNYTTCICKPGYSGPDCSRKISQCTQFNNPCKNDGECIDYGHTYSCVCKKGYSGINCTDTSDYCASNLCQNGGICLNQKNGYSCACPKGYSGKFCERFPSVDMMPMATSPCENHECVHGTCFLPDPLNTDYFCQCEPGFTGKYCEYLSSVTYQNEFSFIELESIKPATLTNITLSFRTTETNGILIYYGQSKQHLTAELFNGRIRVSYNLGNELTNPSSSMYSFETVSDGRQHTIELLLSATHKNFTLRVDNGLARTTVQRGSKGKLDVAQPLYLGGLPKEVGDKAAKDWHIRSKSSFRGCFKEVWINYKRIDFLKALKKEKISAGCNNFAAEQPKTCKGKNCQTQNEEHKTTADLSNLKQATAPSECKKRHIREYFTEGNCKSRQVIKYSECVGTCKNQCCKAKTTKRRKVRMICEDKKKFVKRLKVVRKCQCTSNCN